jgi:hypothetical protein
MFLRNVGLFTNYTALQPKRQYCSNLKPNIEYIILLEYFLGNSVFLGMEGGGIS